MTTVVARASQPLAAHATILVAGIIALAARPVSHHSLWVLAAVGVAAAAGMREVGTPMPARLASRLGIAAAGLAAFGLVRLAGDGIGVRLDAIGVAGLILAGVAEEAFFRGYLDGALRRAGVVPLAVGAMTTLAFALIHVPAYGWWVLPIDLAAGAVLAWQREASGTWTVPAITHVAANLMQMG